MLGQGAPGASWREAELPSFAKGGGWQLTRQLVAWKERKVGGSDAGRRIPGEVSVYTPSAIPTGMIVPNYDVLHLRLLVL